MLKECTVLNGQIINFGEWDYQIRPFEVEPPQYNNEGEVIKEAVYDDRQTNPFPEGATIEQRDVEYDPDRGWYEVGTLPLPTADDRLSSMETALLELLLGGL